MSGDLVVLCHVITAHNFIVQSLLLYPRQARLRSHRWRGESSGENPRRGPKAPPCVVSRGSQRGKSKSPFAVSLDGYRRSLAAQENGGTSGGRGRSPRVRPRLRRGGTPRSPRGALPSRFTIFRYCLAHEAGGAVAEAVQIFRKTLVRYIHLSKN